MNNLKNFTTNIDHRNVLTAWLNVPGRPLNVFDDTVLQDLNEIVEYARGEGKSLKLIVFRSGKPAGFLAGADIHRLQGLKNRDECQWILEQGQALFNKIESLPIPTLAVIHGACVGGGLEFALSCTYRVAVDNAATRIGLPEVKLGLIPAWGGTQRLPRLVGLSTALPMLLQGRLLNAHEAARVGLVNRRIDADNVDAEVDGFIERRLNGVPVAPKRRDLKQWLIDTNPIGRSLALKQARQGIAKHSRQYPALSRILDATEIGVKSNGDMESGLAAERSAFCDLLLGNVAP
ncbi:MAG TPA: enoyl-CoA hydratase-related protein, partial [Planctomicrobium sp.]|nr:enoyl-CoA hydratase-related protein [Planctomicrobium sp.]